MYLATECLAECSAGEVKTKKIRPKSRLTLEDRIAPMSGLGLVEPIFKTIAYEIDIEENYAREPSEEMKRRLEGFARSILLEGGIKAARAAIFFMAARVAHESIRSRDRRRVCLICGIAFIFRACRRREDYSVSPLKATTPLHPD